MLILAISGLELPLSFLGLDGQLEVLWRPHFNFFFVMQFKDTKSIFLVDAIHLDLLVISVEYTCNCLFFKEINIFDLNTQDYIHIIMIYKTHCCKIQIIKFLT